MIDINIYQPKKLDLTVEFPTGWNELQQKEILFIAKSLLTEPDAATVNAATLKFLIENRCKKPLPTDWFLKLEADQVVIDCYPLLDFIFKSNDLTNDPDPVILKKVTYYPQKFENITCGEYEDADLAANKFAATPGKDPLVELASIICRPGHDGPEPYMQFNPRTNAYYTYQASQKEKYFKKLPAEQLYALFIWFAGNRAQLPLMFPTVYEGGGKQDERPDLMAFTKCIHAGAGPKNGTRQQIRVMKLYEFMYDMEQEAIKDKRMEEEIERMKNQT